MQDCRQIRGAALAMALAGGWAIMGAAPARADSPFSFQMQRSAAAAAVQGCAPNAQAQVTVTTLGFAERLTIRVTGFAPRTKMDLFIIQVPNAPFGVAWYLGDLDTGPSDGNVTETFISRLNNETFAVAPGQAPAPKPHGDRDQGINPAFKPIHTFHVGAWFNLPADATRNHCPNAVTPFNGDNHLAGIQVLSTRNFPDKFGPLRHVF